MAMHFADSNKGYIKSDSSISKSLKGFSQLEL
jgi:hypothetical protein